MGESWHCPLVALQWRRGRHRKSIVDIEHGSAMAPAEWRRPLPYCAALLQFHT